MLKFLKNDAFLIDDDQNGLFLIYDENRNYLKIDTREFKFSKGELGIWIGFGYCFWALNADFISSKYEAEYNEVRSKIIEIFESKDWKDILTKSTEEKENFLNGLAYKIRQYLRQKPIQILHYYKAFPRGLMNADYAIMDYDFLFKEEEEKIEDMDKEDAQRTLEEFKQYLEEEVFLENVQNNLIDGDDNLLDELYDENIVVDDFTGLYVELEDEAEKAVRMYFSSYYDK